MDSPWESDYKLMRAWSVSTAGLWKLCALVTLRSSHSSGWHCLLKCPFLPHHWMSDLRAGKTSTLFVILHNLGLTVRPASGKSVSTGHSSQELIQAPWLFLFEHSSVEPYAMLGGSSSQSGRVSLGERETYPREVAVVSPERLS